MPRPQRATHKRPARFETCSMLVRGSCGSPEEPRLFLRREHFTNYSGQVLVLVTDIALSRAFARNFLGHAPAWYKWVIIGFLVANPFLLLLFGHFVAGWILVLEFIFTLALALKCYPLQAGGLLAIEAVVLGMTSSEQVLAEVLSNFQVILLLIFMVAGIYFMKELLMATFTKLFLAIRRKWLLSFLFAAVSAVLSAFLDALTVTAVIIAVASGFYALYQRVTHQIEQTDAHYESAIADGEDETLDQFRACLRGLLMHGVVGTALGGVCTTVGEPQNLLIASKVGWDFQEFFLAMSPVTIPVLACGLLMTIVLEKLKVFGYGVEVPARVLAILRQEETRRVEQESNLERARLWVQGVAAVFLVVALALHLAAVGIIGLAIIVLQTAFNGIIEEHSLGKAFHEALPFTALLAVFFVIVSVIHDGHLFTPVLDWVLAQPISEQASLFFLANGILSAVSDNVFVATVYINQVTESFQAKAITREHYELVAVAINTGTNLPSVATPNGQAAFLFLLTSSVAPLVRLSYGRMVWMALPYTILLTTIGYWLVAQL